MPPTWDADWAYFRDWTVEVEADIAAEEADEDEAVWERGRIYHVGLHAGEAGV